MDIAASATETAVTDQLTSDTINSESVTLEDYSAIGVNTVCCYDSDDYACDEGIDGSDEAVFKADFGRGGYNDPCPSYPTDPWCNY